MAALQPRYLTAFQNTIIDHGYDINYCRVMIKKCEDIMTEIEGGIVQDMARVEFQAVSLSPTETTLLEEMFVLESFTTQLEIFLNQELPPDVIETTLLVYPVRGDPNADIMNLDGRCIATLWGLEIYGTRFGESYDSCKAWLLEVIV